MDARRDEGNLVLQLNAMEAHLLRRVLGVIVENYKIAPASLDPSTAEAWYSARGCQSAGMSQEETNECLAALHDVKSAHLRQLRSWIDALAETKGSGRNLTIDLREADILLVVLNDYRLMTAARHQIGEAEMDLRTEMDLAELPPGRRAALMEIHLLAWVIEVLLAALD